MLGGDQKPDSSAGKWQKQPIPSVTWPNQGGFCPRHPTLMCPGLGGCKGSLEGWTALFQANEADAVTLDAGLVFEAGLTPNNLKPVVAEFYGSQESKFSLGRCC